MLSLGQVFYAGKDYPNASKAFGRAKELYPDNPDYERQLVNVAAAARREQAESLSYKGIESYGSGNFDGAEKLFRQAADAQPNPVYYWNLAMALQSQKRWADSMESLQRAHALAPDNLDYIGRLADAYYAEQKYDEAEKYYGKALAQRPKDAGLKISLGNAYRQQGKLGEAIETLKEAQDLDPKHPATLLNYLGLAYRGLKRDLEARRYYREAIKSDGNFSAPYYNLALSLLDGTPSEEERIEACSQLEQGSAIDPKETRFKEAIDAHCRK